MAVPKRRVSRSRQGSRRAHHYKTPRQLCYCNRCGNPISSNHFMCWNCGWSNVQKRELISMEQKED